MEHKKIFLNLNEKIEEYQNKKSIYSNEGKVTEK